MENDSHSLSELSDKEVRAVHSQHCLLQNVWDIEGTLQRAPRQALRMASVWFATNQGQSWLVVAH